MQVTDVTAATVTCITPAGAEGAAQFVVTSNGVEFPPVEFTYAAASSPAVSAVSPDTGSGAQTLTITGTDNPLIMIILHQYKLGLMQSSELEEMQKRKINEVYNF